MARRRQMTVTWTQFSINLVIMKLLDGFQVYDLTSSIVVKLHEPWFAILWRRVFMDILRHEAGSTEYLSFFQE